MISFGWWAVIKIAAMAGVFSCGIVALGSWVLLRFTKAVDIYTQNLAKILVRHQNLEKLVEETKRLTDAAERIKAELSHENWDRQTRWTARRDLYVQMAQALGDLRTGYIQWKGLERLRLSPVTDQKYRTELEEKRNEVMRTIEQARLTFLHATDTAPLMVPDEPFKPLREYKPRQIRFETSAWEADLEYNIASTQWTLYHFQTAARADLGFEPMIWQPIIVTDGPPVEDGSTQNS